MKIISIDLIRLEGRSVWLHGSFSPIIVRVNTDEGLSGLGEISLAMGNSSHAACACVRDLTPFLLGQDPMRTEWLWERMHRDNLFAMGGGCVIYGGISGIDIALWDLKAQALGVPLYQLLGGKTRQTLRSYASQIQFGWGNQGASACACAEQLAQAAGKAVEQGYRCLKLDPLGYSESGVWKGHELRGPLPLTTLRLVEQRIKAVRDAVGDRIDLIIENHCLTDTTSSIQLARILEPYHILLYEEPTEPQNPRLMREIKEKISLPVATGEKLCNRWRFLEFFEPRAIDVAQPDPGVCGGITECKKICDMAAAYDIQIQLHACHSPISIAAALHLEAAIPNFFFHETHCVSLLPENIALGEVPLIPVGGEHTIPEGIGIGQRLSHHALSHAEIVTLQ